MPAGKIKRRKKNGKKKEKKKGKKKGKEKEKKSTGSLSPTVNLELGPDNPSPQKSYTVICSDVSCGQHYAESCAECPGKDRLHYRPCNGQCEWINNTCVQSTRTPEDLYKSALEKIKRKKNKKKSTGSLSSTVNLELCPDNPSPQKSYIYCHLFRRKLRATLRRELRRVSRKRWMGELLQ